MGGDSQYTINQHMVRRSPQRSTFAKILIAAFALAVGVPTFAVVAPLLYLIMLNKSISQVWASTFLPVVMPWFDNAFSNVKKELLKDLHGRVLDVGCGDGDWLKYFSRASHVTELEPNPNLIPLIEQNVKRFKTNNPGVDVEITTKFTHELDPANPYDYVILGNVMCEVPDQMRFLKDVDRVLKPGGKVVFQEHVKCQEGTWKAALQDLMHKWWFTVSDGCNCNRHTLDAIKKMENWKVTAELLDFDGPPILDHMALGIAIKNSTEETKAVQT